MTVRYVKLHEPIPVSETDFCEWLQVATPGETIAYHRGFLVVDTNATTSRLCHHERLKLLSLAALAYRAAEQGAVHLLQRRIGPDQFSYIAVRRAFRSAGGSEIVTTLKAEVWASSDAVIVADVKVRRLLARYALSVPVARAVAELAFSSGRPA